MIHSETNRFDKNALSNEAEEDIEWERLAFPIINVRTKTVTSKRLDMNCNNGRI